MTAILLGWNPDPEDGWEPNYPSVRAELLRSGMCRQRRRADGLTRVAPGSDAWLVLQGIGAHGLLGHGFVVSGVFEDADGNSCIDVEFDALLEPGDHLQAGVLATLVQGIPWGEEFRFARPVPVAAEAAIRRVWTEHRPLDDIDPILPVPGAYPQSALTRVTMNRYERDTAARRICLAHHGFSCAVCHFDFEAVYGSVGQDFIHIHHLVPSAQLEPGYELDPIEDLLPLCPNCHSIAHRRSVPFSPAELRAFISEAGFIAGSVVTQAQLDSQSAARKLLAESSPL